MHVPAVTLALLSWAATATAYPEIASWLAKQQAAEAKRQTIPTVPFPTIGGIPRVPGSVTFNAAEQLVSVSGDHAWQAPRAGDKRGPCAGLNAAANHNYLPRDGIATFETVQTGLWEAFGLDQTATQVLQQTTSFFDGDPISQKWSIGGFSEKTAAAGGLLSFLGQESGIGAYGHSKSEGDASITRGDFLTNDGTNSNCASYPQFLQELFDLSDQVSGGEITMATLALHQHNRKLHSIATNPFYFSPPFSGVAFTPAAHHFAYALLANRTAERPEGILTKETFMSFFSYTYGPNKELVYTYGHERIPDNWYRRPHSDPWTLADILTGVAQQCLAYPSTCAVGGNTGTVNSFAGVNVGDLSGGLFDSSALTDPAKLGCFLSQNIQAQVPSFLSNVFQGPVLQTVLGLVTSRLVPTLAAGFGNCNGINGNFAAQPKPILIKDLARTFPGAIVQASGPRAACQLS